MKRLEMMIFVLLSAWGKPVKSLIYEGYGVTSGYTQQDLRTKGRYNVLCRE